jgi:hypothetical protein
MGQGRRAGRLVSLPIVRILDDRHPLRSGSNGLPFHARGLVNRYRASALLAATASAHRQRHPQSVQASITGSA